MYGAAITLENGTLIEGDNLEVMRSLASELVDLIYLDPPFFSQADYSTFSDIWRWNEAAQNRLANILDEKHHPARRCVQSTRMLIGDCGMLSYLTFMAERLALCKMLLKETGSLYLHCDPYANYYLRILLNDIFGMENYRNEIIWHYNRFSRRGDAFPSMHDTIFFYGKGQKIKFNKLLTEPKDTARIRKGWHTVVDQGERKLLVYDQEKFDEAVKVGKIKLEKYNKVVTTNARQPALGNVWEIPIINPMSKERQGYPTQKPLALLDRIVKASSNPGDLVLDPFCGCGTALESARNLERQFVGIDKNSKAIEITKNRLENIPLNKK